MLDYLRNPEEITRRSFAIVREEAALGELPEDVARLAERLVHSCGMPEIVEGLAWGGSPGAAAAEALRAGALIIADARMVEVGITRARLPADNQILVTLEDASVPRRAQDARTTRSAAAVDLWEPLLEGAVVAIGNAPTALFRLLELLQAGAARPAAIFGFPVGFVGAAESKDALIESELGVPYLTLRGRRGGSALAASAVNAAARAEP